MKNHSYFSNDFLNNEKEELIGQMQDQMSNFLQTNQELFKVQKQLEDLQEEASYQKTEADQTIYDLEQKKKYFQNENGHLQSELQQRVEQIESLNEFQHELQKQNSKYKLIIQKMKNAFSSELENQVNLQTEGLRVSIKNAIKENKNMADQIFKAKN